MRRYIHVITRNSDVICACDGSKEQAEQMRETYRINHFTNQPDRISLGEYNCHFTWKVQTVEVHE